MKIIQSVLDSVPSDCAGLPSTLTISLITIFLTIWANSTLYLLTPLWFVPLFIMRNPKSDRFARFLFQYVQPLFEVKPIVKTLRGRSEAIGGLAFILTFLYLAIDFFRGDTVPQDWPPLLGYGLLGLIISSVAAGLSRFVILVCLLALQLAAMLLISIGLRVVSIGYALVRHFPYTISRLFENYYRIVVQDDLTSRMEIAPRYDAREYLKGVNETVEEMVKEQSDSIMDSRAKLFIVLLVGIYYFTALAVAFIPSVLPRLCVKASFLPLSFVFVIQPQHLKSKALGREHHDKILKDWLPVAVSLTIMIALAGIYSLSLYSSSLSAFGMSENLIELAGEAVAFLNMNYRLISIVLTCSSTLIIYVLIWSFQKSDFVIKYERAIDFVIRFLSVVRVSCAFYSVGSILLSEQATGYFYDLLGVNRF